MAGKLTPLSLPSAKGKPGDPGDPGYKGAYGTATGGALGLAVAGPVGAVVGAAVGAVYDWLFGGGLSSTGTGAGGRKPTAAVPPPAYNPIFSQPEGYKSTGSSLRDPGAAQGMAMPQNVRLAAAGRLKNKIFGG